MPQTIQFYPRAIEAAFNKEIDFDTDEIKCMLLGSSYTYSSSHKYKSDLTGEISGTGYSAGGVVIGSKTVTFQSTYLRVAFDGGNATWGPGASFSGVRYAVVYDNAPATDATRPLIGVVNFGSDQATNNGSFVVSWDNTVPAIFVLRTT